MSRMTQDDVNQDERAAFGHMSLISHEYVLTPRIMRQFGVDATTVQVNMGDIVTIQPMTAYQYTSTSPGSFVSGSARTSLWSHVGGPQAVIMHSQNQDRCSRSLYKRLYFDLDDKAIDYQLPREMMSLLNQLPPPPLPPKYAADLSAMTNYGNSLNNSALAYMQHHDISHDDLQKVRE